MRFQVEKLKKWPLFCSFFKLLIFFQKQLLTFVNDFKVNVYYGLLLDFFSLLTEHCPNLPEFLIIIFNELIFYLISLLVNYNDFFNR